jgi:hypothetical protein
MDFKGYFDVSFSLFLISDYYRLALAAVTAPPPLELTLATLMPTETMLLSCLLRRLIGSFNRCARPILNNDTNGERISELKVRVTDGDSFGIIARTKQRDLSSTITAPPPADDMFVTNEEWMNFAPGASFVGLSAHAIDLATSTDYALGAFTLGGFEKIVEINPEVEGVTMFAISGYTGDFRGFESVLDKRNTMFSRSDGQNYTWTNNITPARFYIGVKGKMEDGSDAPEDDFLARNGLRYGHMYGFAVDMSEDGPTGGLWRDDFHRDAEKAQNGKKVEGWWLKQRWQWDGVVRNFEYDGSWEYQDQPPYTNEGSDRENYAWWTGMGPDLDGCKTEHLTPDPRVSSGTSFIQTSTCGYFGHYYVSIR